MASLLIIFPSWYDYLAVICMAILAQPYSCFHPYNLHNNVCSYNCWLQFWQLAHLTLLQACTQICTPQLGPNLFLDGLKVQIPMECHNQGAAIKRDVVWIIGGLVRPYFICIYSANLVRSSIAGKLPYHIYSVPLFSSFWGFPSALGWHI